MTAVLQIQSGLEMKEDESGGQTMAFSMMTLIIMNVMVNLISAGAMLIIWQQNRRRYPGIFLWFLDMVLQCSGSLLILMRGMVPDFFSILLANIFICSGAVLLLIGLEQFVGLKRIRIHNYVILAAFAVSVSYYTFADPDLTAREIILSAAIFLINFQISWLLLYKAPKDLLKITRIAGTVLSGYVLVSLVRMILRFLYPLESSNFFESGLMDSIAILLYIGLSCCLTICLIIMVNTRLIVQFKVQEEKFSSAFHTSPYAIMLTRLSDGIIFEVNKGFVDITGYSEEEALGKTTLDLFLWVREEARMEIVWKLQETQRVQGIEAEFRKKSGEMISGLFSANIIVVNNEKCVLSSISDITEISRMKERLQSMATHDVLTGLPNRTLFDDRFDSSMANAQRKKQSFAVISIDVDRFKSVNDNYGHLVGDFALQAVAGKLTGMLRKADTVARFGGDEFVVLLGEIEEKGSTLRVAEKILREFRKPFVIQDITLTLNLSMGIALYPDDGADMNELMKKSDESLYYVKEHGRNNCQLYGSLASARN
jgi:diguanylate cyclase (GGDEF)-like protein/PAS domain S-box-containing protein